MAKLANRLSLAVLPSLRVLPSLGILLGFTLMPTAAQNTPAPSGFEVASVKPAAPQPGGGRTTLSGDTVNCRNTTLNNVLAIAFDVRTDDRISGPEWINTVRYDIVARAPEGTPQERIPAMLKALVMERFALKLRTETHNQPAYILTVLKASSVLKPTDGQGPPNQLIVIPGSRQAHNMTMAKLARILSFALQTPVIDRTKLTGSFDFPFPPSKEELGSRAETGAPTVFTVIAQLGLKLESRPAPFDNIVVEDGNPVPAGN